MNAPLTIGDVARRAGVETSAIRYYERIGLLPQAARQSGQRRYDDGVLQRLKVIAVAKEAGFSLREIEEILAGFDGETAPSERWRPFAEAKLSELDALSARIDAMRALLRQGIACGCLTADDCELLQR